MDKKSGLTYIYRQKNTYRQTQALKDNFINEQTEKQAINIQIDDQIYLNIQINKQIDRHMSQGFQRTKTFAEKCKNVRSYFAKINFTETYFVAATINCRKKTCRFSAPKV